MLPAITANLPAYLSPPRTASEESSQGATDFGPAVKVDLEKTRSDGARGANRSGLYGPDGQFVESNARRELGQRPRFQSPQRAASALNNQVESTRPASQETPPAALQVKSSEQVAVARRDLSLEEVNAAVPPAAREELRELADRVDRRSRNNQLQVDEYRRIADLMERIGRYEDAQAARKKAQELKEAPSTTSEEKVADPDPANA